MVLPYVGEGIHHSYTDWLAPKFSHTHMLTLIHVGLQKFVHSSRNTAKPSSSVFNLITIEVSRFGGIFEESHDHMGPAITDKKKSVAKNSLRKVCGAEYGE